MRSGALGAAARPPGSPSGLPRWAPPRLFVPGALFYLLFFNPRRWLADSFLAYWPALSSPPMLSAFFVKNSYLKPYLNRFLSQGFGI